MKKQIGLIGLGKMGKGLVLNFKDHGWDVVAFNRTTETTDEFAKQGITPSYSIEELVRKLEAPRVVWTMLKAGDPTQDAIFGEKGLINYLQEGDIIIEGGNSFYQKDAENAENLKTKGIKYIDAGVSGGPDGARNGACIMVGGEKEIFDYSEEIFKDLSLENGYKFFAGYGAGHFVKMVHNGIEYGMMQAIAEGFNLMKVSSYKLNLIDVLDIYQHGSVIESRLINWTKEGYEKFGEELEGVKGEVEMLGEGEWTVKTAKEMGVPVPIIEGSVKYRLDSIGNPTYIGKVLSMMRTMFGKHDVK
ncbi:MAG: phosphogluconate dehydrogenase (NAD(+)-dependent, decarboxylating) [Candidatus Dojkabacteria bacterium]